MKVFNISIWSVFRLILIKPVQAKYFIILLLTLNALADDFESLRKRYSSLRNADSRISKIDERLELASELLESTPLEITEKVLALTYAAVLYAEVSTKQDALINQRRARDTLQKLEIEFPNHELLDDAYFAVAVLLPEKDLIFERILKDFPDSDSAIKIKADSNPIDQPINSIVIDPGHGGEDLGAIGSSGVFEKDIVLDIATRISKIIPATLTRTSDIFLPIEARLELAKNAEVFLSLHTNSHNDPSFTGAEVFYFGSTKDATVNALAAKEKASDLIDLLGEPDKESKRLAKLITEELNTLGWKNRGTKPGPFFILSGLSIPAALVEIGFLSNPNDEETLLDDKQREKVALAISSGIKRFLNENT